MGKKGQAEVFVVGLMLVAVVFVLAMCSRHHHGHKTHKKVATVAKLKPACSGTTCKGTYAYKNDSDVWLYYTFMMDSGSASQPNPYANYGSSLPKGGTWAKGEEPKEEEELENDIEDQQVEMDVAEDGEPSDTASDSSDSSDAGSTDSGSSDSGSSGDSGGGDGGGDGGGGGD
jgi:uncharacterized membrane protein YgcG